MNDRDREILEQFARLSGWEGAMARSILDIENRTKRLLLDKMAREGQELESKE